MALGNITVSTAVAQPPTYPKVEGVGLFVGACTTQPSRVQSIGQGASLEAFGDAGSHPLVPTLKTAAQNGGPNWSAYALGLTPTANLDATLVRVKEALVTHQVEFVVLCTPLTSAAEIAKVQTAMAEVFSNGTRVFALCSLFAPKHTTGTGSHANWFAYIAAAKTVVMEATAPRVMCVAPVFGAELGAFAGRLQKTLDEPQGRISRSPMRTASGHAKGFSGSRSAVVDKTGAAINLEVQKQLDGARLSVWQWYQGQQGLYFADANTLASAAGDDAKVIEHLRVLDKAARRIYLRGVQKIADDRVQNTPAGNAVFGTYLSAPLRDMVALGEIKPLEGDAVSITWPSTTQVNVRFTIQPPNAPKQITTEITLNTGE